jgi:formylglycine-generating enzyme
MSRSRDAGHADMVWIPGGTFRMGSEEFYVEERPVHEVAVNGFWIDRYAVTNEQFARFVAETGYLTVAERPLNSADFPGAPVENLVPGSMVFRELVDVDPRGELAASKRSIQPARRPCAASGGSRRL